MSKQHLLEQPPVVIFAFNRPQKLRRVLAALKDQGVARLLVFVDGPRGESDRSKVLACQALARGVTWTKAELYFSDHNHGLDGISQNISQTLDQYPAAIFLEDDCLPVPGFYHFMRQALARYAGAQRVFSIGGYQHLPPAFFRASGYPYSLISGARFTCWGWATWSDRWQEAWPNIQNYASLFDNLRQIPEVAGRDVPVAVRDMLSGRAKMSWDMPVVLATLWLKKVHLLPVQGLVRTIGLDLSGVHGSLTNTLRALLLHNRNVAPNAPQQIQWLDELDPNCDYLAGLRDFVARSQTMALRRQADRVRTLARRYVWPRREVLRDLHAAVKKNARRALLSYIAHPFFIPEDDPRFVNHTNIWHAHAIVQVLNRLGYTVDVIDYRDRGELPRQDYDLFIGHGGVNFERICRALPQAVPKLYFTTGSYWRFHNHQEEARFADLEQRRGARLPYDRYIAQSEENALWLANGIIGIGNQTTRQTYADFERVVMLNGTALYDDNLDWCPKDFSESREHFLFYSGSGNVHKGLDLLLEAFSGLPQHLWISTRLDARFAQLYAIELNQLKNIHLLGWVQPRSRFFYQMMQRCAFCILPSCSEGQSQSVIEAMNQGLIPLVSRHTGLDVQGLGAMIEPVTVESIRSVVQIVSAYSTDRCLALSTQARQAALTVYSQQAFLLDFQKALEELLG